MSELENLLREGLGKVEMGSQGSHGKMAVAATGKAEPRGPQQSDWNWDASEPVSMVPCQRKSQRRTCMDATSLGLQGEGGSWQWWGMTHHVRGDTGAV